MVLVDLEKMSHETNLISQHLMCIDTVKLNKFLPSSSSYCMIHQVFRRRVKLNDCNGTFLASPHGNGALYSFPGTFALTSESRWAIQKAGKIEDFCNFLSWFVSCVRLGSTTSGRSVSDIFHPLSSSKVKVQGMENLKWETRCWYMIPHRQSTIGDGSLTSINSEFTLKRSQQQVLWNKCNCTSDFS